MGFINKSNSSPQLMNGNVEDTGSGHAPPVFSSYTRLTIMEKKVIDIYPNGRKYVREQKVWFPDMVKINKARKGTTKKKEVKVDVVEEANEESI